jgi:LPS export ABC transporter protein LptC
MFFQLKKNPILIGLVVIVIVATGVLFFVGKKSPSEVNQIKILSDNVDLQVRDVLYTDVGDSGLKWEIKADTASYMKSEQLAVFDKVTAKIIMQDGMTFVMTGNKGRMNTETKDLDISGDVTVTSNQGEHFTTDVLKYSNAEQRIYTDSQVVMENARMRIRGTGMSLSLKDRNVTLSSKVTARINGNDR